MEHGGSGRNGRRGGTDAAAWPSWLAPKSPPAAAAALEDSKLAKPGKWRRERERERERWEREGREGADMYSEFGVIWGGVSVGSMVISPKQVWHFDFIFSYKSTSVYHPKHFEDDNHGNSPSWGGPLL